MRALLADGHEVHGLVRDRGAAAAQQRDGVILHSGDMREPGTYVPLVGQMDSVVQAAQLSTAGRVTRARAAQVFAAEHTMTAALAQACLDLGRRLLYTGGCFDWGDHGDEWITEHTALSPSPMGEGHAREARLLQRMHAEQGANDHRHGATSGHVPANLAAAGTHVRRYQATPRDVTKMPPKQ